MLSNSDGKRLHNPLFHLIGKHGFSVVFWAFGYLHFSYRSAGELFFPGIFHKYTDIYSPPVLVSDFGYLVLLRLTPVARIGSPVLSKIGPPKVWITVSSPVFWLQLKAEQPPNLLTEILVQSDPLKDWGGIVTDFGPSGFRAFGTPSSGCSERF